ncbi:uncharacterized protein XM38_024720 [Halomicronema hongdechloris C2206]|uniref:Zn-dependent hydrolase n=1 Tax=Halomicronema hongdechloris C2206 TaxID=1641165 RepID=A0A1Z3HMI0_9CYAN|nr:MBL fold metallo-hydrolase [Halomicronema hongdechloris]ASC71520.1 uncharacterized protein XM38_024720 [Halomicronema hongdechloris C2206]
MKRRHLVRYAGAGFLATLGLGGMSQWRPTPAQSSGVTVRWLGHTSFLFSGGGRRILANPFRSNWPNEPIGCTAGYRSPAVASDLVLISSRLFDEGYLNELPGDPQILSDPGVYEYPNLRVQGIGIPHDREGGRRFGTNVIWRWNQGGINLVHMGGAAAPLQVEQQILLGRPDVLFVPVGGGPKAYTAEEAAQAVQTLNPKLVVPTHYRTQAADPETCDIEGLDGFLALMEGTPVSRAGETMTLQPASLPSSGRRIQVMSYAFG